jgi:hypothetical protein
LERHEHVGVEARYTYGYGFEVWSAVFCGCWFFNNDYNEEAHLNYFEHVNFNVNVNFDLYVNVYFDHNEYNDHDFDDDSCAGVANYG